MAAKLFEQGALAAQCFDALLGRSKDGRYCFFESFDLVGGLGEQLQVREELLWTRGRKGNTIGEQEILRTVAFAPCQPLAFDADELDCKATDQ